jgi:hypothetical protein
MAGGQSGGTSTQVKEVPTWAQPYALAGLQQGTQLAQRPYQEFSGMTQAPMNQAQVTGLGMTQGRAISGNPLQDAAGKYMLNTFSGGNTNPIAGQQTSIAANPMMGQINAQSVAPTQNAMYGLDNPYLNARIGQVGSDIQDNYAHGTAAQTDSAFARDQAFGGSAYNETVGRNNASLAGALAKSASDMRMQDYTAQQGLAENYASRGQQSALANQSAGLQAQQANLGSYESAINRGVGAQQTDLARNAGLYGQQQANAMGQLGYVLPFANQDYTDATQMYQSGAPQNAYTQSLLSDARARWQGQQDYPSSQLDSFWRNFSNAVGNSAQSTVTQGNNNAGWMQALSGFGVGAGLFGGK